LQDRDMVQGKATAYLCERGVCQLPVTSPKALAELLEKKGEKAIEN
jgi:uncharacterized protein YyaL (SSP411 family)